MVKEKGVCLNGILPFQVKKLPILLYFQYKGAIIALFTAREMCSRQEK